MGFAAKTNGAQQRTYTGLHIQTSAQGVPVPLLWGIRRIGTNLIWQSDFKGVRSKKGTGKGGEGKNPINKYTVAVEMALCEGPIATVGAVWQDKTITTLQNLGLTLFLGNATQAAWSYLSSNHPTQALTYAYTAYVANSAYDLGRQPTLPNHNYEVMQTIFNSRGAPNPIGTAGWVDMNPAAVIQDFLTNPQYSIGLPSTALDSTSLTTYQNYCNAQGFFFSPHISSLEQVSSVLDRWAKLTNTWIFWSGNAIKFVPLGDAVLDPSPGPFTQVDVSAIPLAPPVWGGSLYYGFQARIGQGMVAITDGGVKFQDTGVALTSVLSGPSEGQYICQAAYGIYLFNSADAGRPIVVTYTRAYSATNSYTPNTTPVYNFTYDDFVVAKGAPPVTVSRVDPADAPNHVKLEVLDRGNAYNTSVCEWKDQGLADQFGLIDAPTAQAHEFCWPQIGQISAQLIGQRAAYIRNTYEFKLGWEYGSVIEPGDIHTITDPHIGLSLFPVRIVKLDEDHDGNWAVTAEEFPGGIGTVSAGSTPTMTVPLGGSIVTSGASGSVNPPAVFEPNSSLTNGVAQLWIAASGGSNWGGCVAYVSMDGVNYTPVGTISMPAIQGVSTAILADSTDPDTVNTLSLDTTQCATAFPVDATHADADAFRTLSLITPSYSTAVPTNGEMIAYGTAATTGTYTANLSYLRRGLYGSAHSAHASGSFFSRFDLSQLGKPVGNSVLVHNLPPQYIAQAIYLKFCSFNLFGANPEDLSAVTAYTYTPLGTGYGGGLNGVPTNPVAPVVVTSNGQNTLSWTPNPLTDNVTRYNVYRASGLGAAFASATEIGVTTSPNYIDAGLTGGSTYTYFVVAQNAAGTSINSAGTNATTGSLGPIRYDIDSWMYGTQSTASQLVRRFEAVRTVTIPTTGHQAGADTAATASTTFTIYRNGTSVGTVAFAASGTVGTFTIGATISLAAADVLEIKGPATADATLANVNIILAGTA